MKILLVLLIVCGCPVAVQAQAIEGIGFYQTIVDKAENGTRFVYPERPIAANSVRLGQLPMREGRRTVYVAATLTLETAPSNAAFLFQRTVAPGDTRCSQESDQIVASDADLQKLKSPNKWDESFSDIELVRRKIADITGGSEAEIKGFKLKIVSTEPGERTYYDYRFVSCPGQVRVWVVDSGFNVMAPAYNNPGIVLNIGE